MYEVKTVKVLVTVGIAEVMVVLTAVLAVDVRVGRSALRFSTLRTGADSAEAAERLARWRSRRERAWAGSTMRVAPRFQCRRSGRGMRVGWNESHGSGQYGLDGTVQDGVTVCVATSCVSVQ